MKALKVRQCVLIAALVVLVIAICRIGFHIPSPVLNEGTAQTVAQ